MDGHVRQFLVNLAQQQLALPRQIGDAVRQALQQPAAPAQVSTGSPAASTGSFDPKVMSQRLQGVEQVLGGMSRIVPQFGALTMLLSTGRQITSGLGNIFSPSVVTDTPNTVKTIREKQAKVLKGEAEKQADKAAKRAQSNAAKMVKQRARAAVQEFKEASKDAARSGQGANGAQLPAYPMSRKATQLTAASQAGRYKELAKINADADRMAKLLARATKPDEERRAKRYLGEAHKQRARFLSAEYISKGRALPGAPSDTMTEEGLIRPFGSTTLARSSGRLPGAATTALENPGAAVSVGDFTPGALEKLDAELEKLTAAIVELKEAVQEEKEAEAGDSGAPDTDERIHAPTANKEPLQVTEASSGSEPKEVPGLPRQLRPEGRKPWYKKIPGADLLFD